MEMAGITVVQFQNFLITVFFLGSAPVVDVSELKDKLQAHANEQNRAQIKESFENLLDKIANELKSYNIRSSEVKDHVQKFIDSRPTFLRTKNRRQIQINNLFNEISRNKLWSFDDLWEVIVESFKIPSMTALLKSIVHNCLIITWLIEPSWACCILSEIFGSISFFTKHLITKVLLGDVCIYDEHSGIIGDNKVSIP